MKKKKSVFDVILDIILVLLAILIIYWLIQLILGGSPEISEVNFTLIVIMAGLLFKLYRETGKIKTEMKHLSMGTKESFNKIKEDTDLIKKKLKLDK